MGQDETNDEAEQAAAAEAAEHRDAERARIAAERTERKLRRARRAAVGTAHAVARAQGFEARKRLPWPACRDQDPMAQLPDAEIAKQRDRALVDGNVDDYRVRRELLQLRKHARRAGRAYGAVQRLGFLATRDRDLLTPLRFLAKLGIIPGGAEIADLVRAVEEAAGRRERNQRRAAAARARARAALDGPRPPATKAERALVDVADLVLNESDLLAIAERLAVGGGDAGWLADHYRRLHAEVRELSRTVFGVSIPRKVES